VVDSAVQQFHADSHLVILGDLHRFLENDAAVLHALFVADSLSIACHADDVGPFVL
jgi:hypothetical protein